MRRVAISERPHWKAQAEEYGFSYHTMYGEPYWCEDYYYEFSLDEIEEIETATEELHGMALKAVERVVHDDALLEKFAIPRKVWPLIRTSWEKEEPSLYGRFDFAYDGKMPPKMLEYNADTPTSLFESAFFQWLWFEDQGEAGNLPEGSDQFNSIQEALIDRFVEFKRFYNLHHLHFACCDDSVEDRGTTQYLQDCATDAEIENSFLFMEEIGIGENLEFTDPYDGVIEAIFKLYPWEFMFREDFAEYLGNASTLWLEPAWKGILSNKALLPLMWEMFPHHPNLLEAYFDDDPRAKAMSHYVRKPLFSREGANIEIIDRGEVIYESEGPYGEEGAVLQAYYPLPKFEDNYTLIGSWIVGETACGIGIREDKSLVTQDLSRFYPHMILPVSEEDSAGIFTA